MAKLRMMFKDKTVKELQLGEAPLRIGRDPDNDVQLDNPAVSRHHAEIYRQGYAYYIEDKKSTNGTFLNGKFLTWKSALNHDDRLQIGKHTFQFIEEAKDTGRRQVNSYDASETLCIMPDTLNKKR